MLEAQPHKKLRKENNLQDAPRILGLKETGSYQQIKRTALQQKLGQKQSQDMKVQLMCYELVVSEKCQKDQKKIQVKPQDKNSNIFTRIISYIDIRSCWNSQQKALKQSLLIFELSQSDINNKNVDWIYNIKKKYYSKFLEEPSYKKKLQKLQESYEILKQKIKLKAQ